MKHHKTRLVAFVGACLLFAGTLISAGASIKIKVTAELANIRQKPSISSPIIRQFPEGTILEATVKEGEWYLITMEPDESGATAGYVHESLVLPLGEEPKKEVQTRIEEPVVKKEPEKVQKTEPVVVERQKPEVVLEEPGAPINLALTLFAGFNFMPAGDLNTARRVSPTFMPARSASPRTKRCSRRGGALWSAGKSPFPSLPNCSSPRAPIS
jgi:hypothetical protein